MVSLGGLDVAFGSSLQLVRTNVLVVDTDGTPTQAQADIVHSIASQKWTSSLQPDFTGFVDYTASPFGITEGYATALTDQVENSILKDISAVPLAGSQRDATGSNNRGLAIEAILNVGIVTIEVNDTATVDDLFNERDSPAVADGDERHTAVDMQSALMKTAFDAAAPAQVLDLTEVLKDSDVGTGTPVVTGDLSSLTDTSTAAALNDAIGDSALLVSVMALGRVL
jgi:hypothetical protein